MDAELLEKVAGVGVGSVNADIEAVGDLLCREAVNDQVEDLLFPRGQGNFG